MVKRFPQHKHFWFANSIEISLKAPLTEMPPPGYYAQVGFISMDVLALAKVSGIPLRRLRYVLEHRVLPGADKASRGRRVSRSFTGFECFGTAVAAIMMEAGLKRSLVADTIALLTVQPLVPGPHEQCSLLRAYGASGETYLEIGDGVNVRLQAVGGYSPFDTAWLQAATGAAVASKYSPWVLIRIDVGRLRQPIRKEARE